MRHANFISKDTSKSAPILSQISSLSQKGYSNLMKAFDVKAK